jgi:hypothetical protein
LIFVIDRKGGVYRWLNTDLGYGMLFWFPVCGGVGVLIGGAFGMYVYFRFVKRRDAINE